MIVYAARVLYSRAYCKELASITIFKVILLLQIFPSYGTPNGKGLICEFVGGDFINWSHIFSSIDENGKQKKTEIGFKFENDKVQHSHIEIKNDKLFLNTSLIFSKKIRIKIYLCGRRK